MRVFLAGALCVVVLGCGPSRGTVMVGSSGYYGAGYANDGYSTSYVDVDSYALGLQTPSLSLFYEQLSPYGSWIDHSAYGRVFVPTDRSYVPYRDGQWIYTDAGWYWQANEPFGWAVTHYGQWDFDDRYGWLWVPGTQWAPSWVDWRTSGDMIGWAPRPPRQTTYVTAPERRWHFTQRDYLTRPDVRRHVRRFDRDYVRTRTEPISSPTTYVPARPVPRHELQRVRGIDRDRDRRQVTPPSRVTPRWDVEPPRATPPPRVEPVPQRPPRVEPPRRALPPRQVEPPRQAEPPRQVEPPRRAEPPPRRVVPPRVPARNVAPPPAYRAPDRDDDRNRGRGRDRDRDRGRDDDRKKDRDDDRSRRSKDKDRD